MRILLLLMLSFSLSACYWGLDDYHPSPRYAKGDLWVSNFRDGNLPATAFINDKIYCSTLEIGSDSSNLFYCLDLKTGKVDWAVEVAQWATSPPIIGDSFIYYSTYTGKRVYRFDKNGNKIWERNGSSVFDGHTLNPLNNNLIYHSLTNGSYEMAYDDGAVVNRFGIASMGSSTPVFYGKYMVQAGVKEDTTTIRHGMLMRCIDYTSKKKVWEYEEGDEIDPLFMHEGKVYYISKGHIMQAIDIKTGSKLWKTDTLPGFYGHYPSSPQMVFDQGKIIYWDYMDNMIVVDEATGKLLARTNYQGILKQGLMQPIKRHYEIPADDKAYYSVLVTDSLRMPIQEFNIYIKKVKRQ